MPSIQIETIVSTNSRENEILAVFQTELKQSLVKQDPGVLLCSDGLPSVFLRIGFSQSTDSRNQGTCVVLPKSCLLAQLAEALTANVAGVLNRGLVVGSAPVGLLWDEEAALQLGENELVLLPLFLHETTDAVCFVNCIPRLSEVVASILLNFILKRHRFA